ncbi:MAG: Rrf2 family transcriptional regulator [Chloroflexi bacterium]|nr:Rrf2 family transcriptional regulator [Chloroflexota bacterium]
MQLSRKADYAVRAMLELAMRPPGATVIIRDIAERQEIPRPFLAKIIPELVAAGLLRTDRGNQGGVSLTRSPETISLLEIIEAIEGPLALNRCTYEPSRCASSSRCAVDRVWVRAQVQLNALLRHTRLDTLAQTQRSIDQAGVTSGRR